MMTGGRSDSIASSANSGERQRHREKNESPQKRWTFPMKIQYENSNAHLLCECLSLSYICFCTTHPQLPITTHTNTQAVQIYGRLNLYIYCTNRIWKTKRKRRARVGEGERTKKSINVNNFSFTLFFRISHWVLFSIQRVCDSGGTGKYRACVFARCVRWLCVTSEYLIWGAHIQYMPWVIVCMPV